MIERTDIAILLTVAIAATAVVGYLRGESRQMQLDQLDAVWSDHAMRWVARGLVGVSVLWWLSVSFSSAAMILRVVTGEAETFLSGTDDMLLDAYTGIFATIIAWLAHALCYRYGRWRVEQNWERYMRRKVTR